LILTKLSIMFNYNILTVLVVLFSILFCYDSNDEIQKIIKNKHFLNFSSEIEENTNNETKNKNQFIAMGLSAILPGAGQIYNGNWKRGMGYLGIEFFLLSYRKKYNDKGDHYVDLYKDYANKHWSFENWVKNYYLFNHSSDPVYSGMVNDDLENGTGCYPENSNSGINGYCHPWSQAHSIEWYDSGVYHNTTAEEYLKSVGDPFYSCGYDSECIKDENYFDDIVVVKDHHFHEGIGKYNLYFAGWDDVNECVNNQGEFVVSDDCRWIENKNGYNVAISKNKKYYQDYLRAKSNDKYDYAENALTIIFINHAVSMLDALITSSLNKDNKEGLNFHSEPIYNLNYDGKIEGVNFYLEW